MQVGKQCLQVGKNPKHVQNKFSGTKKGKGKGKSKNRWEPRTPQAIRGAGGVASTPNGDPICFNFNLSSCKGAADGARCSKGFYLCPICFGPRSMKDHSKH